uniref:Trimethylguanosine synthase n=1 Tax=viral metagenome TaxID=1070528 RepID=A0A6C0CF99_9ZZZZ
MGYTRRNPLKGRARSRMEILFPKKTGVDYDKLQMTEEGEYSITKRRDGEKLIQIMKDTVKNLKAKTITDMTGNVGGDTILFGLHFKKVHSYEINPDNFKALQNNVETFKLKNVELHQGDSVKAMSTMDTDIVYIDAPWGGLSYKEKDNLDLYLGKYRVDEIARTLLETYERGPDYVFLKVPANYNFARLDDLDLKWEKYKIRGFYIVCLFQH